MRDILFRGKRVDNGEWVEGYYLNQRESLTDKKACYIATNNGYGFKYKSVLPETVGQYTGLTDKNGRKIFEGDIVRYEDNIGYVIYTDDDASFLVDSPNKYIAMDYSNEFEVIGNIYDNPELLKGGNENG